MQCKMCSVYENSHRIAFQATCTWDKDELTHRFTYLGTAICYSCAAMLAHQFNECIKASESKDPFFLKTMDGVCARPESLGFTVDRSGIKAEVVAEDYRPDTASAIIIPRCNKCSKAGLQRLVLRVPVTVSGKMRHAYLIDPVLCFDHIPKNPASTDMDQQMLASGLQFLVDNDLRPDLDKMQISVQPANWQPPEDMAMIRGQDLRAGTVPDKIETIVQGEHSLNVSPLESMRRSKNSANN